MTTGPTTDTGRRRDPARARPRRPAGARPPSTPACTGEDTAGRRWLATLASVRGREAAADPPGSALDGSLPRPTPDHPCRSQGGHRERNVANRTTCPGQNTPGTGTQPARQGTHPSTSHRSPPARRGATCRTGDARPPVTHPPGREPPAGQETPAHRSPTPDGTRRSPVATCRGTVPRRPDHQACRLNTPSTWAPPPATSPGRTRPPARVEPAPERPRYTTPVPERALTRHNPAPAGSHLPGHHTPLPGSHLPGHNPPSTCPGTTPRSPGATCPGTTPRPPGATCPGTTHPPPARAQHPAPREPPTRAGRPAPGATCRAGAPGQASAPAHHGAGGPRAASTGAAPTRPGAASRPPAAPRRQRRRQQASPGDRGDRRPVVDRASCCRQRRQAGPDAARRVG